MIINGFSRKISVSLRKNRFWIILVLLFFITSLAYVALIELSLISATPKLLEIPVIASEPQGIDYFILKRLSPFSWGDVDFSQYLPDFPVVEEDGEFIKRRLKLYYGEKVLLAVRGQQRYVLVVAYGESRLDRLLDEVNDYIAEGFFEDKLTSKLNGSKKNNLSFP